jgi:UDP-N-acetylglucosamine:LPS N-acetylglucosamine transferase
MDSSMSQSLRRKTLLAVSSSGGHWTQLQRLVPAFDGYDVVFVTVDESYRCLVPENRFCAVGDASRWNKFRLLSVAAKVAWIVYKEKPDIVVSTGAAPGYFAMLFGHLLGARTIWVDSLANIERLSLSGRLAGKHADLWLTQWPHLAKPEGPQYAGAVL